MALSAYLLMPEMLDREQHSASRETQVFMAHGVDDPVVPFALGESSRTQLDELGMPVDWHTYPMQHSVCNEEIVTIGHWLERCLIGC